MDFRLQRWSSYIFRAYEIRSYFISQARQLKDVCWWCGSKGYSISAVIPHICSLVIDGNSTAVYQIGVWHEIKGMFLNFSNGKK